MDYDTQQHDLVGELRERIARLEQTQENNVARLNELEKYDGKARLVVLEESKETQTKMLWLILTSLLGQALKAAASGLGQVIR
jgi:hypothetical protein